MKIGRRGFFGAISVALAGIAIAPAAVFASPDIQRLTFRSVPLVFDEYCPSNSIYFFDAKSLKAGYISGVWMQ